MASGVGAYCNSFTLSSCNALPRAHVPKSYQLQTHRDLPSRPKVTVVFLKKYEKKSGSSLATPSPRSLSLRLVSFFNHWGHARPSPLQRFERLYSRCLATHSPHSIPHSPNSDHNHRHHLALVGDHGRGLTAAPCGVLLRSRSCPAVGFCTSPAYRQALARAVPASGSVARCVCRPSRRSFVGSLRWCSEQRSNSVSFFNVGSSVFHH